MKQVNKLNPFGRFCCTIGNLPTSYMESLTYEQQLMWFCKYLEEKVVPAVNENADAIIELQEYLKNLDLQDEVNNKLDEMVESGELQEIITQYLQIAGVLAFNTVSDMKASENLLDGTFVKTYGFNTLNDGGGAFYKVREIENTDVVDESIIISLNDVNLIAELCIFGDANLKQFGAVESNSTDVSNLIVKAITYAYNKNISSLKLNGSYYVDSVPTVSGVSNVKVCDGTLTSHITNSLLDDNFNYLKFSNCENVIVENVKFIELNPSTRTRTLRKGGLLFDNCTNCICQICYFENTMNGPMLYNSKGCSIINNIVKVTYQSNDFAESAILNYASSNSIITGNKIYGEFYDGVLSIFGSGSTDVVVSDNILNNIIDDVVPTHLSQGITVDSGVRNCIVSNNIVYDMFYGIDNKSDTYNTLIDANTLIGCKIAIADRRGENVNLPQTFNSTISNNKILFREDYDTDNIATYLHYGKYYYVGILTQLRNCINIKNNDITLWSDLTKPVLGIEARSNGSLHEYDLYHAIRGNKIDFVSGHGANVYDAPTGSTAIVLNNLLKGIISDNVFKVIKSTDSFEFILLKNANENLQITNNGCYMNSLDNHLFIKLDDEDSSITKSEITNNKIVKAKFPYLNSVTNIIQEADSNREVRMVEFTMTNTYQNLFKLYSQYNNPFLIGLELIDSYAGIKYLVGMYRVTAGPNGASYEAIVENKNNVDVDFVDGDTRYTVCQVKSNTNFVNPSRMRITVYQPLKPAEQRIEDV